MSDQPSTQLNGSPGGRETPVRKSTAALYPERPSLTQKSRHIGERLIEGGIYTIAGTSIIFIFLIFFFVFREASPIVLGSTPEKMDVAQIEQYSLPAGLDSAADAAGTTSAPGQDTATMEVYNGGTDSIPLAGTAAAGADSAKATGAANSGSGNMEVYNAGTDSIPLAGTAAAGADSAKATAATDSGGGNMEVYNPGSSDLPMAQNNDTAAGGTTDPSGAGSAAGDAASGKQGLLDLGEQIRAEGYPLLTHDSPVKLEYIAYHNWQPNSEHPRYGIYPIIVGTIKTTVVALLFATPLAILAALYTAFFAPKRLRETIKPIIELLAGFPSVVLGFFCLMTVASIVQALTGTEFRLNSVVGGIGLGLAVIPIIYTITEDSLRAVPQSLREAALALGASEWEAAYKVMLPAATPGIFAAVLLGLGRAFGETMIALMATGNAGTFSWNFFEPVRTFAATIGAEMGEVVFGSPHYQLLFLLGVILFVFSFAINLVTEFYVKARLIKKFRGTE